MKFANCLSVYLPCYVILYHFVLHETYSIFCCVPSVVLDKQSILTAKEIIHEMNPGLTYELWDDVLKL